ncbi:MAG: response regulator transcription factor [Chloroflexi bacterium]|nr:response regulator transcription factor [Chloroflexota bacterium]
MTETLLLIEDDITLCEALRFMLTKKGFQVEVANSAITGLQKAYAVKPDAIILDIMLPDMDGWQTCARFREMSDVPIIMLTALGSEENVVKGLNLGADDYIIKPVTAEELSARVRALLRRVTRSTPPASSGNGRGPIFTYENLVIDFDKHEVTVEGKRVDLSPTEFRLLSVLVRHKGRMLPHEFLLTEVWGPEYVGEIDYLRLYISYLRRKIEKDPTKPTLIHNEWGVGYRFG